MKAGEGRGGEGGGGVSSLFAWPLSYDQRLASLQCRDGRSTEEGEARGRARDGLWMERSEDGVFCARSHVDVD